MEVVPGIHLLKVPIPDTPLGHLNSYLVQGERGSLLIDTGWNTEEAFNSLEDQLRGIGLRFRDITQIVITHMHPDHYGLAGRLKRITPARLVMHHWETALIEARYVYYAELQNRMSKFLARYGVPESERKDMETASEPVLNFVTVAWPDDVLYGVETIDLNPFHLRVLWTPGHSPGHICLYDQAKKFLFSGDHILPTITANIPCHVQSGSNPLGDYLNSLRTLNRLHVDVILPAHETVFHDLSGRISQITEHHVKRAEKIVEIMGGKPMDPYQVAARFPWHVKGTFEGLPVLQKRSAVVETISHLEAMWMAGRVEKTDVDDVVKYKVSGNGGDYIGKQSLLLG
ncbi:MAG: MBL fold metallo-hydrolase [Chloroflexi bacterium]|nr:MBL fold metallo-hydrolase [Chloroflexota bacterium]